MAHPHNEHRSHKVERKRLGHILKHYESGGVVSHSDAAQDRKLFHKMMAERDGQAVEGHSRKERADRRAHGGRTKHKGHKGTSVNVIVAPNEAQRPPIAPPVAAARPPAPIPQPMPQRPPIPGVGGPPPGGPPMGPPPGMPPPGIRKSGGRTYAKGGRVKSGPAWEEGLRSGTQVQNNPSGKNDQTDVGRGKVITYKTGGKVEANTRPATPHPLSVHDGGGGGGHARLVKEHRAAKNYARA